MSEPIFAGGVNIAMKIPKAEYEATVAFYREVLGFDVTEEDPGTPDVSRSYAIRFGPNTLWLDCVDRYSRPDLWLELRTDDLDSATRRLAGAGTGTIDEIEELDGASGHWIKNPAGIVHLLVEGRDLSGND